jgi:hypothetical protein
MVVPVWEKATSDKGRFGLFGIAFNYAAQIQNVSTFAFKETLKKSTVAFDGRTIVSEGRLAI